MRPARNCRKSRKQRRCSRSSLCPAHACSGRFARDDEAADEIDLDDLAKEGGRGIETWDVASDPGRIDEPGQRSDLGLASRNGSDHGLDKVGGKVFWNMPPQDPVIPWPRRFVDADHLVTVMGKVPQRRFEIVTLPRAEIEAARKEVAAPPRPRPKITLIKE